MTIRVGVDSSGPARAALMWALARASERNEPLIVIHVIDDDWSHLGRSAEQRDEADDAHVLDEAMDLAEQTTPTVAATSRLVHGSLADVLTRDADESDTIVIGTHKTGYLRGRVIGTRGIAVATAAPCNIAVIPDGAPGWGVVVGIARGPESRVAAVAAAHEAARSAQSLTLVHALGGSHPDEALARQLLAASAAAAAAAEPWIPIQTRVARKGTVDALLDASHDAALLVLGASRSNRDSRSEIGSVIHDVLLNLVTPVLIAKYSEHWRN